MTARRRRLAGLLLPFLLLSVALTGCTHLGSTGNKQYIQGEGQVIQVAPGDRGKPVVGSGKDLAGHPLDLTDYRGKVVVLNVWASWCPPCRAEMPTVVGLADALDPAQVQVLGINIRQSGGTSAAQTFATDEKMTFPSFYDPSSSLLLRLSDKLGPYSLPSTIVLDRQGRLAALVLGEIPGKDTMKDVVDQVVAGG